MFLLHVSIQMQLLNVSVPNRFRLNAFLLTLEIEIGTDSEDPQHRMDSIFSSSSIKIP